MLSIATDQKDFSVNEEIRGISNMPKLSLKPYLIRLRELIQNI